MSDAEYRLSTGKGHQMRDIDEQLELRAMVASGDCFDLLASRLDQIMRLSSERVARPELEHVIRLLLDLQARYKVIAKPPSEQGRPIVV